MTQLTLGGYRIEDTLRIPIALDASSAHTKAADQAMPDRRKSSAIFAFSCVCSQYSSQLIQLGFSRRRPQSFPEQRPKLRRDSVSYRPPIVSRMASMMRAVITLSGSRSFAAPRRCFARREEQALVELALRQQLAIYAQRHPKRPRTRPCWIGAFWVALSRLWPRWKSALVIVQPETVVRWQKRRFRDLLAVDLDSRAQGDLRSRTRSRLSSCEWPPRTAGAPGRSKPSSRSSESG